MKLQSNNLPPKVPVRARNSAGRDLLMRSALYREYLAEREEVLRHKWIESEKAGCDIGLERAQTEWVLRHRASWLKARRSQRN